MAVFIGIKPLRFDREMIACESLVVKKMYALYEEKMKENPDFDRCQLPKILSQEMKGDKLKYKIQIIIVHKELDNKKKRFTESFFITEEEVEEEKKKIDNEELRDFEDKFLNGIF